MYCQKCGIEVRFEARFCRGCGEPVEARKKQRESKPRLTVALPREESPPHDADSQSGQSRTPGQIEASLILPIKDNSPDSNSGQKTPEPDAEIIALTPRPQSELPQLIATARVKRNIKEKVPPPMTGLSRPQEEVKPFFEQVWGADPESQQKRLIAVVPLVLLVVILLFVFAYYVVW